MARAFAAAGCAVVATARSRASMRGLEGDPRYLLLELDVRYDESARRAVADALREFGRVDVLVNDAGVHLVAPLAEVPMDSFQQVFDTNVYGAMRMIQAVMPHMMERREGTIVNVGSITALAPGPWAGAYSAPKAALHALSDTLRVELRNFGINVMIVAPGGTKSNIGSNSADKYDEINDWKYYKAYEKSLRARTEISQGAGCVPAEDLAKRVVKLVLKKNPPAWFAYGQFTAVLTILYYAPLWSEITSTSWSCSPPQITGSIKAQDIVHAASTGAAESGAASSPLASALSILAPQDFPAQILWLPSAAAPRFNIKTVEPSTQTLQRCSSNRQTSNGARLHLRHRSAQEPVPRREARARQCRLPRRHCQARDATRRGRRRGRRQEVLDPGIQERRRVHRPVLARWLAPRRLRLRPARPRQGPGVPQVVQGGRADPRAVGDGGRAGHLRRAGLQRRAVVRGRRAAGRGGALLLRDAARHPAAAHGVGGVEAVGGLLQPGLAVGGVGHAVVAHRRELRQLHRRPGLPRRQVLRPARPGRRDQGRRLHPRRRQARPAQACRDQALAPRHARHAHLLLRGRTGQDAARRARPINSDFGLRTRGGWVRVVAFASADRTQWNRLDAEEEAAAIYLCP